MNPERLLEHFDRLSEAPDAIPRLRQVVLELAVRGKLVPQNPGDEPVAELLKWIQAEKERLVKEGEIKKLEKFAPVKAEEIPFVIPSGWQIIRMGWLARKLGAGSTPLGGKTVYQSEGVPFLRSQNVHDNGLRLGDVALIPRAVHERMSGTHVQQHDVLLNITGASIGRCALIPRSFTEGNVSQHVAIIRLFAPEIRSFVHLSLTSPFFQKLIDDVQVGVSREGLSMQRLKFFPMPLPPLAEQHRIVAKVDELMALCDQLEAAKTERERSRDRLVAASLHHLNQIDDAEEVNTPEALRDHARFIFNHLPRLTTRPAHIMQLRQIILNLAVRGKLVPQDAREGDASEMLREICEERERRIRAGEVRRVSALQLTEDELGLDQPIPSNWEVCFIDKIAIKVTDGEHATPERCQSGRFLLSARNVTNTGIDLSDVDFVPESEYLRIRKRCDPDRGDILISCSGSVGRVAIVDRDDAYVMVRSAALVKLDSRFINSAYVAIALRSSFTQEQISRSSKSTAQANLFIGAIRKLKIPLPPLAEQHRIVAKVDELMALCDQLEAKLTITEADSRRLLEAMLHEALNPPLEATEQ